MVNEWSFLLMLFKDGCNELAITLNRVHSAPSPHTNYTHTHTEYYTMCTKHVGTCKHITITHIELCVSADMAV